MATPYDKAWQLATLPESVDTWNAWREEHPEIKIDLSQMHLPYADLQRHVDLSHVNLSHANLSSVHLSHVDLIHANLSHANLSGAVFYGVDLTQANLSHANLSGVELTKSTLTQANLMQAQLRKVVVRMTGFREALLREADLSAAEMEDAFLCGADLRGAVLRGTDLRGAVLQETTCIGADFSGATLSDCYIYGMSSEDVQLVGTQQQNLCITPTGLPEITVDGLNVAQYVSALLNNTDIPTINATITRNVVLILGRFLGERRPVPDALRNALRERGYRPVACNFRKLSDQRYTEGITLLARRARFIIADLTHPGGTSTVEEVDAIVPTVMVPVQPLIELGSRSWETYKEYSWPYPWVLPMQTYATQSESLASIQATLIVPAEAKAEELQRG